PEIFNVNHYIISQARPCLFPLFRGDLHRPPGVRSRGWRTKLSLLTRLLGLEIRHRLLQLDYYGFMPTFIRRILIEEDIPGSSLVILPELSASDLRQICHSPTIQDIKGRIRKGERGVWPAMSSVKVRCTLEFRLERAHQSLRERADSNVL